MSLASARIKLLALALVIVLLTPLLGCEDIGSIVDGLGGSDGKSGPTGSGASSGAIGPASGRLRLYGANPGHLDPARTQDVSTWQYLLHVYSGLVRLDGELQVVPDAAEGWTLSNGGRTYRFTLREGLKFHDGKPVTASDFKYSLERAADPATRSPAVLSYLGDIVGVPEKVQGTAKEVSGVSVVDDRTLEITIDAPKSYFLSKLTYPTAFVVDKSNVESGKEWWRKPNGTGPFRVKEWVEDDRLVLESSGVYYGAAPTVQQVSYYLGGGSPMTMYERDELDVIEVGLGDIERVLDPDNELNRELQVKPMLSLWYIGFNSSMPPFDDQKVRQAFSLAADKDKLVNITYKRTRLKAEGILPPGMPGYDEDLSGLGFDPERARKLIGESKYGSVEGLPEITLTMSAGGGSLGESLAEMYRRNLGVRMNVTEVGEGFYDDLSARAYQMFYLGWVADYADPQNFLDVLLHSQSPGNHGGYSNPQVDQLLEQARVETDEAKRIGLYQQVERLVVDDGATVPLFHDVSHILLKPRVRGLKWTPMGILSFEGVVVESGASARAD